MKIHMLSASTCAEKLFEASRRVFTSIPPLALLQDIVPDVLEGGYSAEAPYSARYDTSTTALDRWYASGWLGGEAYLAPQPCEAYVSTLDDLPTVVVEGVTPTSGRRWQAVFGQLATMQAFSIIADGGSETAFGEVLADLLQPPFQAQRVRLEVNGHGVMFPLFVGAAVCADEHGDFEVAGVRITPATSVVETRSA